ncbi:hypothetical protein AN219_28830, partial [Streptomyces nanshensis]
GQAVTLTATVSPVAPGTGTPTGTVTFTIDGGLLTLTEPLVNGTATTTTTTPTGTHTIEATYNATTDPDFTTSTDTITHTVDP